MTKKQFKDNLISDLFKSKTMRLRVDTILYAGKVDRCNRPLYLDDIIGEIFLVLCKKDEAWFWDTFNQPGKDLNDLIGYATNVGYNLAIRKSNNSEAPKACLLNEYRFASSFNTGRNNYISPVEDSTTSTAPDSEGVENAALADTEPDYHDKNEIFNYLQQHLTPEEIVILNMLTDHKKKPGRKKAEIQHQMEEVQAKVKTLLDSYSKNFYKSKAWSIGQQMQQYKLKHSTVPFTSEEQARFSQYKDYKEFEPLPVSRFDKYNNDEEKIEDDD